jgi:hypothetical protein
MAMATVAVAGLATALVTVNVSSAMQQRQESNSMHARYVCQAGLAQGMYELRRGNSGAVATPNAPSVWGASSFWVTATALTADVSRLTATAIDDRHSSRMELTVREVPNTIWRFAAFGKEELHMDSNARVDSYNSTLGLWDAQASGAGVERHALTNGDVGSNGDVNMDQNSQAWGDATAGPDHSTTVLGNAEVTGTTLPMDAEIEFPPLVVPSFPSVASPSAGGATVASGDYTFGNVTLNANKTLNITGPARIVMTNFTLKSGSQVVIDASAGPVEFWVIDDFKMSSNSQIASTDFLPKNVKLNLLSDNVINPEVIVDLDDVDFDSNSKLFGTIYAPNAKITIDSNFELFGSMLAREVDLDSNCFIHFDEDLLNSTASAQVKLEVLCWRELPVNP